jgi:hypothetical protein
VRDGKDGSWMAAVFLSRFATFANLSNLAIFIHRNGREKITPERIVAG